MCMCVARFERDICRCGCKSILIAVGAVDSFVLLVYIGDERLDPHHVFCILLRCVPAEILVDWALAALSLREEEGRV